MHARDATLVPVFSLENSKFGNFLYAPIGEEQSGVVLTALSAFARMEMDPWQEAARLAQLPLEAARQSMTSVIAALPNGRWTKADSGTIAARLIALLPAPPALPAPLRGAAFANPSLAYRIAVVAFFLALNTAVFLVLRSHEPPLVVDTASSAAATTKAAPTAPLADSK